jgi:hypothetical protein
VTLVASLALIATSLVAWLSADPPGVGLHLPLASSGPGSVLDAAEPLSAHSSLTDAARGPVVAAPGRGNIPRRDATRIPVTPLAPAPIRVVIPSVNIDMSIVPTGVRDDGQLDLPEDPNQVGWYRFGPQPGADRGSVVLAGHVDSRRFGVGPLARLAAIRPGARISITVAEGERIRYQVLSVKRIRKAALPTDRLFAPNVEPRLVLVTCGGRYLSEAGGYEDNIVVVARPA